MTVVKNNLNQTSEVSLRVMSFPNSPVNQASKTLRWSCMKAFLRPASPMTIEIVSKDAQKMSIYPQYS